jgi:hypothetical protein
MSEEPRGHASATTASDGTPSLCMLAPDGRGSAVSVARSVPCWVVLGAYRPRVDEEAAEERFGRLRDHLRADPPQ